MNHKKIKPLEVTLTSENNQRDITETIGRRQHMAPSPKNGRNLKKIEPSSLDRPEPTPSMELFFKPREKTNWRADKQTRERRRHLLRIFLRFLKQGFFPEVFKEIGEKNRQLFNRKTFPQVFERGFFLRFFNRTIQGNITKYSREVHDKSQWTFPQVFERWVFPEVF